MNSSPIATFVFVDKAVETVQLPIALEMADIVIVGELSTKEKKHLTNVWSKVAIKDNDLAETIQAKLGWGPDKKKCFDASIFSSLMLNQREIVTMLTARCKSYVKGEWLSDFSFVEI